MYCFGYVCSSFWPAFSPVICYSILTKKWNFMKLILYFYDHRRVLHVKFCDKCHHLYCSYWPLFNELSHQKPCTCAFVSDTTVNVLKFRTLFS